MSVDAIGMRSHPTCHCHFSLRASLRRSQITATDSDVTRTPRNLLPLIPMIAAMILFAAFHFLPAEKDSDETGWVIWQAVFLILRHSADLDALAGIGLASFLMFSVLIVSSPFLIGVWRKSKLALGLAAAFSGLGTFGFWIMS
jgi:hypothetical protein